MKIYGLGAITTTQLGWFGQSWVQLLAAEWEIIIALWLLSGSSPKTGWFVSVITFLALGGVSGYFISTGVANCCCLGVVSASPWWTLAVDILAIVGLFAIRPRQEEISGANWSVLVATVALVMLGSTLGSILFFGSPEVAVARLRGGSMAVSPERIHLGRGSIGTTLEASVVIHNWAGKPLRIYGGTADCTCIATSDLPITIPDGESRMISIRLRTPNSTPGTLNRTVEFLTDHPRQGKTRVSVSCEVVE
jgi:hypothetical protein